MEIATEIGVWSILVANGHQWPGCSVDCNRLLTVFCTLFKVSRRNQADVYFIKRYNFACACSGYADGSLRSVNRDHGEKIITKNGESYAALIDTERLDYYQRLDREHVHIKLLEEAVRGLHDVNAGNVISIKKLKTLYRR